MFCAGRAVMGFGTSAALAVAPAHLQEIAHPRYRAPLSAFCELPSSGLFFSSRIGLSAK